MVEITVIEGLVDVRVIGWHRLWCFKSRLSCLLSNVRSARRAPRDFSLGWWHGLRMLGTNVPGVIVAGSFRKDGEKHFWDVTDPAKTIIVELRGETYDRLFLEVADPDRALAKLRPDMPNSSW